MTVFKDLSIALRSSREDDDTMAISTALKGKKSVITKLIPHLLKQSPLKNLHDNSFSTEHQPTHKSR
jgi:hypothetical protein